MAELVGRHYAAALKTLPTVGAKVDGLDRTGLAAGCRVVRAGRPVGASPGRIRRVGIAPSAGARVHPGGRTGRSSQTAQAVGRCGPTHRRPRSIHGGLPGGGPGRQVDRRRRSLGRGGDRIRGSGVPPGAPEPVGDPSVLLLRDSERVLAGHDSAIRAELQAALGEPWPMPVTRIKDRNSPARASRWPGAWETMRCWPVRCCAIALAGPNLSICRSGWPRRKRWWRRRAEPPTRRWNWSPKTMADRSARGRRPHRGQPEPAGPRGVERRAGGACTGGTRRCGERCGPCSTGGWRTPRGRSTRSWTRAGGGLPGCRGGLRLAAADPPAGSGTHPGGPALPGGRRPPLSTTTDLGIALALMYAELGQLEAAGPSLACSPLGFEAIPRNLAWSSLVALVAEVCALTGQVEEAAALYRSSSPGPDTTSSLARQPCASGRPRGTWGLAAQAGDLDQAVAYLEEGLAQNRSMRARPQVVRSYRDLAEGPPAARPGRRSGPCPRPPGTWGPGSPIARDDGAGRKDRGRRDPGQGSGPGRVRLASTPRRAAHA